MAAWNEAGELRRIALGKEVALHRFQEREQRVRHDFWTKLKRLLDRYPSLRTSLPLITARWTQQRQRESVACFSPRLPISCCPSISYRICYLRLASPMMPLC